MENSLDSVAEILKMLGHPNRIRIVLALTDQPAQDIDELMKTLALKRYHLDHNLIMLQSHGLLISTEVENKIQYSVTDPIFQQVIQIIRNRSSNRKQ